MPGSNRNKILSDFLNVFEILLDGNSHTVQSFKHLNLPDKTIRRILLTLENHPRYKVRRIIIGTLGVFARWKCEFVPKDFKRVKIKECFKCGKVSFDPYNDFHLNKRFVDGIQDVCKICKNKGIKKYRKRASNYIKRRRANSLRSKGSIVVN